MPKQALQCGKPTFYVLNIAVYFYKQGNLILNFYVILAPQKIFYQNYTERQSVSIFVVFSRLICTSNSDGLYKFFKLKITTRRLPNPSWRDFLLLPRFKF